MCEPSKIDENILIKYSKKIQVDPELPFRMQKTQLFRELGLPIKKTIPIQVKEKEEIKTTLAEFLEKKLPFFIVTSPKPMPSRVPPLFRVNAADTIIYRDFHENIEMIDCQQVFAKIDELPPKSWVEFTENIWGGDTIVGRLLYISLGEQILEIQRGIEIGAIGNDRINIPYFNATLSFFEPANIVAYTKAAFRSGFKEIEIRRIIDSLKRCYLAFEGLREIAQLPAIEFGFTNSKGLQVIDVDWPCQFQH